MDNSAETLVLFLGLHHWLLAALLKHKPVVV